MRQWLGESDRVVQYDKMKFLYWIHLTTYWQDFCTVGNYIISVYKIETRNDCYVN